MATTTSQRVFIWIIAAAMLLGTFGMFASLILANQQAGDEYQDQQAMMEEYYQQMAEEAKKNRGFDDYQAKSFDGDKVTKLIKTDLKVGDGEVVKEGDTLKLSYFGWTPDGVIFDSTTKVDQPNQPIELTVAEGQLIDGWVKGVPGMKVGGVRQLEIPAAQAYGAQGSQPLIGPNTPLMFILRVESISS